MRVKILIFLIIIGYFIVFFFGFSYGFTKERKKFNAEIEDYDMSEYLANYSNYRDISTKIYEKKYTDALNHSNDLKNIYSKPLINCMKDLVCHQKLSAKFNVWAPELLVNEPSPK